MLFRSTAAHIAQACFEDGCLIPNADDINGFNEQSRMAILEATQQGWPQALRATNAFYGHFSWGFFIWVDDEGNTIVSVIFSKEGVKMGCPLATRLFSITKHHFVYSKLLKAYPEVSLKAIVDDTLPIFPPPEDPENQDQWEARYDLIAQFWLDYDKLANPIGLFRNLDKGACLLPSNAPQPRSNIRLEAFDLKPTWEGLERGGVPIGTEAFVHATVQKRLKTVDLKIEAVTRLSQVDVQMAIKLLCSIINQGFNYLIRGVPPSLMEQHAKTFDNRIFETLIKLLYQGNPRELGICPERRQRARTLASLPATLGGLGFTPLQWKAPIAYLASMMAGASDPVFREARRALQHEVDTAFDMALKLLGLENSIPPGHPAARILPTHSDHFFEYGRMIEKIKTKRAKVQSMLMELVNDRAKRTLEEEVLNKACTATLSKSDAAHLLITTRRSQLSRVITSPRGLRENEVQSAYFSATLLHYLNLPQPQIWGPGMLGAGNCRAEICRNNHDTNHLLDQNGDHLVGCTSTHQARQALHDSFNRVLARAATEIPGMTVRVEPPTVELLHGDYTEEECRSLFPSRSTVALQNQAATCAKLIQRLHDSVGPEREAHQHALTEFLRSIGDGEKGLRADIAITAPNGLLALVDGSCIHSTCMSYRDKNFDFLRDKAVRNVFNTGDDAQMSPAVKEAEEKKKAKYLPLLNRIKAREERVGIRHSGQAQFFGCIMTHDGEFSDGTFQLIEWLVKQYRVSLSDDDIWGNLSRGAMAADFRSRIKDALVTAMANGWGRMLKEGGFPLRRRRRNDGLLC